MQTQDKKIVDLKSIDTVKAFLTLSVLIYHSILAWSVFGWHSFSVRRFPVFAYLCDFLLKFHTPAFTFLSGYLFYYLRYEKGKYRNRKKDIANRAKRLLLPYAVMLLWVTPFHFLFEAGTIQKVLLKYILVVAPSQLWYLIMLFGVFVIFHFISDRLQKHPLVNFIVFYGIYGCATVLAMVLPDYFQCWTILKSLLFFYFGYAVRQGVFKGLMKNARNIYVYISVCLYSVLIFVDYRYLLQAESLVTKVFSAALDPIITLIGIATFVALFSRADGSALTKSNLFGSVRQYNFTIYLFHQQLVYIPLTMLPNQTHPVLMAVVCAGFALFGSLGISMVLGRFSATRNLFGLKTTTNEK